LDEPTTHLDIHHQVAILSLVRGLAARDEIAVLAVWHDLNLAATFADRLVMLVDGRVVFQGTPAEVLRHEHLAAIYGDSVTILPRPDGGSRPGVLPRRVEINP
jgi:iron complex transport system ATP-binding protein